MEMIKIKQISIDIIKTLQEFLGKDLFNECEEDISERVDSWASTLHSRGYVRVNIESNDFDMILILDTHTTDKPKVNEKSIEIWMYSTRNEDYTIEVSLEDFEKYKNNEYVVPAQLCIQDVVQKVNSQIEIDNVQSHDLTRKFDSIEDAKELIINSVEYALGKIEEEIEEEK